MIGNIEKKESTYGFIYCSENKQTYFFHKSSLTNCTMFQLEEGDSVEFQPVYDASRKKENAQNVRKRFSATDGSSQPIINPGLNSEIQLDDKNEDELKIIDILKKYFYISRGGKKFSLGGSTYNYILVKLTTNELRPLFDLPHEIVVVFSDYISFEPRSLDAASEVIQMIPSQHRLERGCQILISNDSRIEERLNEAMRGETQNLSSIVIPFSYREFLSGEITAETIKERFRKYLFDVDLFATKEPIRNDMFFFGRRDYVRDIVAKCKTGIHCGAFGLRRSGKTSLLYAVQRLLQQEDIPTLYIFCPDDLKPLNWKSALYHIVQKIQGITHYNKSLLHTEDDYKRNTASNYFEEDLCNCLSTFSSPLVLLFDEIEGITYGVEESGNSWKDGDSFPQFWEVLRGFCTKHPAKITFVIAGTNPMINELPTIGKSACPNTMFGQLSTSNQGAYLPSFNLEATKAMVDKLGSYMGMKFDDTICAKLVNDCGGHPYLIRLFCSNINKYIRDNHLPRPITISSAIYEKAAPLFEQSGDAQGFFVMVLNILQSYYAEEFDILKDLANGHDAHLAILEKNRALEHLIGYGLIDHNCGHYSIRFDAIKRYLQGTYRFERTGLSIEEQKEEIRLRFDTSEQKLRQVIKNTLHTVCGLKKAHNHVIEAMEENGAVNERQVKNAKELEYKQLFDPTVNTGLYYSTLIKIIEKNFSLFFNIFDSSLEITKKHLLCLNRARQLPSHSVPEDAQNWAQNDFYSFRKSMSWLEEKLQDF